LTNIRSLSGGIKICLPTSYSVKIGPNTATSKEVFSKTDLTDFTSKQRLSYQLMTRNLPDGVEAKTLEILKSKAVFSAKI